MAQCQMLGVQEFKYFMDNWFDLGMITKNQLLNINIGQLIQLNQQDREDFVQNKIEYTVSFGLVKNKTGDLFPITDFFSLDSERRALFCSIVKHSFLFYVIKKLPISIIDFFKLDLNFIKTLEMHNTNCFLLVKYQYLQPAQLLQLSINEITFLCSHFNKINNLMKKQTISLRDLFELPENNRTFIIENADKVINLLSQNKMSKEMLLSLSHLNLIELLTKPEFDDSNININCVNKLKVSFFTQMPCDISDEEMVDSAFGQKKSFK